MLQSFAFYRAIESTFSSQRRRRVLLDAGTVVIEQIVIEIATGKLSRLEVRETAAVMAVAAVVAVCFGRLGMMATLVHFGRHFIQEDSLRR